MEVIDRLKLRLGIDKDDNSKDDILTEYLNTAEDAVKLFLNTEEFDSVFIPTQLKLAYIYYHKDSINGNVKSESHSEGPVSESATYKTTEEYDAEAERILNDIKRYRKVHVRHKKKNQPEENG
ncbi:MAG: phage head-tail connector protein [Lachnospiraceae bacterium]|nr:phage head-tail connector protein [Lachnospiraceae bacterium]